ncbi:hypothetical protein SISSUDRAFT_1065888 [Sistotremastrum suecicum HHB10207 ss-3]|uniref:Uncharacterized protein n=1 Tax=Sistotremastrum suecicum HHB10207 ss-3 TaxID=1314776 RepID=A0A165YYM1_9AGAM|nr:hypothetical protein SISSUDRAFT_1065888 [Sistotremastrum suecicum HHB10207 ss-3]
MPRGPNNEADGETDILARGMRRLMRRDDSAIPPPNIDNDPTSNATSSETLNRRSDPALTMRVFSEFYDEIVDHLCLRDAVYISQACRRLRPLIKGYLGRALLNRILGPYVDDPHTLRDLMRRHKSVVSGSSALDLIMNDRIWSPNDLDIFCPKGSGETLMDHLINSEGYEVRIPEWDEVKDAEYEDLKAVHYIYRLEKPLETKKPSRSTSSARRREIREPPTIKIDIIESTTSSALKPLTFFRNTLCMNFLSADYLIVLYPILTFQRQGILQIWGAHDSSIGPKYRARGYTLYTKVNTRNLCKTGMGCPNKYRSSSDVACMQVHFGAPRTHQNHNPSFEDTLWLLMIAGRRCSFHGCPGEVRVPLSFLREPVLVPEKGTLVDLVMNRLDADPGTEIRVSSYPRPM